MASRRFGELAFWFQHSWGLLPEGIQWSKSNRIIRSPEKTSWPFFVQSHRGKSNLQSQLIDANQRRVCGIYEGTLARGKLVQTVPEGFTLAFQTRRMMLRIARKQIRHFEAKDVALAHPVSLPRQDFELRHAERPPSKVPTCFILRELFPQHDRDLLHDIVCIRKRGNKGPHKCTHRWFARHKEAKELLVPRVGSRVHRVYIPGRKAICRTGVVND
jgi:hypothetical protein